MYLEFPSKELWYEGEKEWSFLDHTLVQILVVVANRQVRTLSTDVRKVFNAIAFSIELVDLKASPNWSIRNYLLWIFSGCWKGNRLKFLYMVRNGGWRSNWRLYSIWICKGDLNKHYDGNINPIQSYLFCIKAI
jgi:hypothetical protein